MSHLQLTQGNSFLTDRCDTCASPDSTSLHIFVTTQEPETVQQGHRYRSNQEGTNNQRQMDGLSIGTDMMELSKANGWLSSSPLLLAQAQCYYTFWICLMLIFVFLQLCTNVLYLCMFVL